MKPNYRFGARGGAIDRASEAGARPDSIRKVLARAPRPVWVLVAGVFVNRLGSYFASFVVLFLTARGIPVEHMPPMLAGVGVAAMVGSLTGGWLADRVGRKRALIASMIAAGAGLLSLAFATEPVHLVLSIAFVGLTTQSYVPAASALLVDYTPPADRVTIFATFRLSFNAGATLGALLAGAIASVSYTALFVIDGGTCLAFALLLFLGLPKGEEPRATRRAAVDATPATDPVDPPPARRRLRRHAPIAALCLAALTVFLVYAQHRSTLPLRLDADGLPTEFYGAVLFLNGFLVILFEVPISGYTRRLPWNLPLIAGMLLVGIGIALSGVVPGRAAILATVAVWTLGEMLFAPVANTAVAALSPPDRIGRYQGVLATGQTLGLSLGPAVGTAAYAFSPALTWVGAVATGVVAALLVQVASRAARRQATTP